MTRPTVFVAGASGEPERVRWAMDAVEREGWFLALDWLAAIDEAGTSSHGLTRETRRGVATVDAEAVKDAAVFWLLSSPRTRGGWVELGMALAWHVPVVCSGPDSERCIYGAGVDWQIALETRTDGEALDLIRRLLDED